MAEGNTIASAYVQILPSTQGIESELNNAIVPAAASAGTSSGTAMGAGLLAAARKKLLPIASVIGLGTLAKKAGSALLGVGQEFDAMTDIIVIGTGATGEALDGLVDSATNIASEIPVSFEKAGDYVQNFNTRMGLVGENLEAVGERTAALSKLFGSEINLDKLTGAFNAFNVADDQAAEKMDYLFGVSQSTGIGFDALTGILESNAPALQNLGFSFEEAANMAGMLDKAGMDANGTMSKMSKALVSLAEPGEDVTETYRRVIGELDEFIDAGDTAAALDLATEIFGTRGAAQFVGALQSGAMSLDQIADNSLGASEGILATYEATADYPDLLAKIENKAKKAFEPMGGAMMEAATKALTRLGELLDSLDAEQVEKLADAFGEALVTSVDALAMAIEFLVNHYEEISGFFNGVSDLAQFLQSPPILGGLASSFESMGITAEDATAAVSSAFGVMASMIGGAIENAKKLIDELPNFVASIPGRIVEFFSGLGARITSAIGSIHFPTPHVTWETLEVFGMSTPVKLPHVSWYAAGGWIDDATLLAGVGEKGGEFVWPSYEPYLSQYAHALASEINPSDGGYNVYIDGQAILASPMLRDSFFQFMNELRGMAVQNVR